MEKKHYIIIIGILVVLNIFSWRIWWEAPGHKNIDLKELSEKRKGRRGGGTAFLAEKLKLNAEQKLSFENLKKSYFAEVESIKDSMNLVRKELIQSIGNEDVADNKVLLFKQMSTCKLSMEKLTIRHFSNLRNVCNEDQKMIFDTLMIRMMEHNPMLGDGGRSHGKHKRGEGKMERKNKE